MILSSSHRIADACYSKRVVFYLVLALIASYCALPLFIHHSLPDPQDTVWQIFLAGQFDHGIRSGSIYPRWVVDAVNGYGSPTFLFYAPLPFYLVSAIHLFIPSLITSMAVVIWCGFFFSGVTMFMLANKFFNRGGSLLSAVMYQILPFHLFDLYVRGTFSELAAYVWFPLIVLLLQKIHFSKGFCPAIIGLALAYASLILTHLVSAFMFTIVIVAYLAYYYLLKYRKNIFKIIISLVAGLGISALYLMPVLFERKYVHFDIAIGSTICNYNNNFLFSWDNLLRSRLYLPVHLSVVLSLLFVVILLASSNYRDILLHNQLSRFFIFLFAMAFFLTTPLSKFLWANVPFFPNIYFPWRWVRIMDLSLSFLAGYIFSIKETGSTKSAEIQKRTAVYLFVIYFLTSLLFIYKPRYLPEKFLSRIQDADQFRRIMDPVGEYIPIWSTNWNELSSKPEYEKATLISGRGNYHFEQWEPENRVVTLKTIMPSTMRISTFYYPGWEARLDGNKTDIRVENISGNMLIDVPEGDHVIRLTFNDTPLRRFSKGVSLCACLILAVSAITFMRKKPISR